jgi:AcrR family transcriptional regulator
VTTASVPADGSRTSSRAALLEAALDEFSTKGYEAATVADIAERAGVTTGALYAHFRSKLDLLLETTGIRRSFDLLAAAAALSDPPWDEAAVRIGDSFRERLGQRTVLLLDVIVLARRDAEVAASLRKGFDSYIDAMTAMAKTGIDSGVIDPPVSPDDLARTVVALALGFLVLGALDEPPPSREAFVELTNRLLHSESDGGAARRGASPLDRVRALAVDVDAARAQFVAAIAAAVDAGHSLRAVGAAAGLSHERVRQLIGGAVKNT